VKRKARPGRRVFDLFVLQNLQEYSSFLANAFLANPFVERMNVNEKNIFILAGSAVIFDGCLRGK